MTGLSMGWIDWLALFTHFIALSLLVVGGAIGTAPEMQRYLVVEQHWLTDAQFSSSVALAQAAPGPNVLFVALLGWNVGLNAGGYGFALLGMALCLAGILVPSSTLTFMATRWGHQNRERLGVRAFKQGMTPIVVALMLATGWLLSAVHDQPIYHWRALLLTVVATLLVWRTQVHLLWLLGAGALLGALGWI